MTSAIVYRRFSVLGAEKEREESNGWEAPQQSHPNRSNGNRRASTVDELREIKEGASRLLQTGKKQKQTDKQIARINIVMAANATLSVLFWLIEFNFCVINSQPTCNDVKAVPSLNNPNVNWRVSYDWRSYTCEALYTVCSLVQVWLLVKLYRLLIESMSLENQWDNLPRATFAKSGLLPNFIIEFCLCTVQPIPFLNTLNSDITQRFGDSNWEEDMVNLGIIMVVRLYPIIRCVRDRTIVYKKRRIISALQFTSIENVKFGWDLSLRVFYFDSSALFTVGCFITTIAFFTMAFYIAEWNSIQDISNASLCDTDMNTVLVGFELTKSWYLAIITATTVGYGDITPQTQFGRFISSACAISGVLNASLLVATFCKWLELSNDEKIARNWCKKYVDHAQERIFATRIIQRFWRQYSSRFRNNGSDIALRSLSLNLSARRSSPRKTIRTSLAEKKYDEKSDEAENILLTHQDYVMMRHFHIDVKRVEVDSEEIVKEVEKLRKKPETSDVKRVDVENWISGMDCNIASLKHSVSSVMMQVEELMREKERLRALPQQKHSGKCRSHIEIPGVPSLDEVGSDPAELIQHIYLCLTRLSRISPKKWDSKIE